MTDQAAYENGSESQPTRRYMGLQVIVDITGRDQDEVWKAVETALCGACDTGERDCTIESMASCTHADFSTVVKWLTGE